MAMEHRRSLYGHTIKDTHTLFESLDRDGSGFLSPDEIRDGLHRLGLNFADHDFDMLMRHAHFDENKMAKSQLKSSPNCCMALADLKRPLQSLAWNCRCLKKCKTVVGKKEMC